MGNLVVQAYVRSTLTQELIDRPVDYDLFDKGIFKRPIDFIHISWIAFNSAIIKALTQEIFVESFSTPDNPDPGAFLHLADKQIVEICKSVGNNLKVASTSRIRKAEGGYLISLPVFHGLKLEPEYLLALLGFSPNDAKYALEAENDKAFQILVKMMKGSGIEDLGSAVDFKITPSNLLAESAWFKKESVKTVSTKAFEAYSKFVKGFRVIAPPVPKNIPYTDPGRLMDELNDKGKGGSLEVINLKDASAKKDFILFSLGKREFTLYADLFIPTSHAEYITQSPASKINPSYLALWASLWMIGQVGDSKKDLTATEALTPISSVRLRNKVATKNDVVPERVNEDSIATMPDGRLIYIPTIDRVDEYEADFQKYTETESGEYCLSDATKLPGNVYTYNETQEDKRKQSEKKLDPNTIVYTDWVNRKISYTDEMGLIRILDLEGSAPSTPVAIKNLVGTSVLKGDSKAKHIISALYYSLISRLNGFGKSLADFTKSSDIDSFVPNNVASYRAITTALNNAKIVDLVGAVYKYMDADRETAIKHGVNKDVVSRYQEFNNHTFADFHEDSPIGPYRAIGRALKFLETKIDEDAGSFISMRAVENALVEIAVIRSINKHGGVKNGDLLNKAVAEAQKPYTNPKVEENHVPTPIPYIKDETFMFPHQNKVDNVLSNNIPKFTILDVAAGGGKTFLIVKHLVELLFRKKAKKPLVICPGGLVKNYVEEVAYFFKGKVNIVCITTKVYRRHGEEYFRRLIEAAPPNTIYVTDYSFVKSGALKVFYGNKELKVSKNTELLRMFDFDVVAMDEAHFLRNESSRTKAAKRLVSDIGRIVLATGTLITKELSDVVNLMAMFDPGIFGDRTDFNQEYAAEMHGNRVISWKPGAEAKVREIMSKNCTLIKISSKEWAALLPYKNESFHFVDMTGEQRALYQSILEETVEQIREFLSKNKKAAALMRDEDDDSDSEDDDIDESMLEMMLRPYLQRLEMFLTAPERDKAGSMVLKGESRVGPKVKEIIKICRSHFDKGIKGKIIIFTSYNNSATSIYENMPADLKKMTVHYHAESKEKDLASFTRDDSKQILVGIEESMKEGFNLQMASRIIRVETIWNPGSLDQAQARIDRPDPKNLAGGERSEIYLDWICVDRSIDITKSARLISRILSKVKFDEYDNPKYDNVGALPIISMSLESILEVNDFQSNLKPYLEEYSEFKTVQREDYEEYRNDPKNKIVTVPVKRTKEGITDAAYLPGVPYIYDMTVPLASEMGAIPFSDYVNEHSTGEGFEDFDAVGLRVHTELGDGEVVKTYKGSLRVQLDKGYAINAKKLTVSVLTKKLGKQVTEYIAEKVGMPVINTLAISKKVLKKEQKQREEKEKQKLRRMTEKPTKPIPNKDEEENKEVYVFFTIINGMISVGIDNEPDADDKVLKKLGFAFSGPYYFANVPTYQAFDKLLDKLIEGFQMRQKYVDRLEMLLEAFTRGRTKLFNAERAMQMDIRNFYLARMRKVKKGWLRPYPVIQDGELFVCATIPNQPSAIELPRKVRVPTVTWEKSDGEWVFFAKDKAEAKRKVIELKNNGVNIANMEQLKKEFEQIRITKSIRRPKR